MKKRGLPRHVIGGVALTNGLLLHAPDAAVLAVRDMEGNVQVERWKLPTDKHSHTIMQLVGVRGFWLLARTIIWNSRVRSFVHQAPAMHEHARLETLGRPGRSISAPLPLLGLVAIFLLYVDVLFLLDIIGSWRTGQWNQISSSLVQFALTALLIFYVAYKGHLWDYMGYHGAEHQTIAAYESGKRTVASVKKAWPYQPRCGAAVVSYVAVFLVIAGFLWPNISFVGSIVLTLGLFSLSYEIVLLLDRYDDQIWARVLSAPGVLLQLLVARFPDEGQSEVAATALFELTKHSKVLHPATSHPDLNLI